MAQRSRRQSRGRQTMEAGQFHHREKRRALRRFTCKGLFHRDQLPPRASEPLLLPPQKAGARTKEAILDSRFINTNYTPYIRQKNLFYLALDKYSRAVI